MDGQSVCTGCGSEFIVCARVSLFTNVTLWPTEIVTCDGLTPPGPIVIVAPIGPTDVVAPTTAEDPPPPPEGPAGEPPPPHAASATSAATTAVSAARTRALTFTCASRST
jgi:hypothetical protein